MFHLGKVCWVRPKLGCWSFPLLSSLTQLRMCPPPGPAFLVASAGIYFLVSFQPQVAGDLSLHVSLTVCLLATLTACLLLLSFGSRC